MQTAEFVPNYIRNRGKSFDKHKNGMQAGPVSKKKRTDIPGAIKNADEVEAALAKTGKRTKAKSETESGVDRRTAGSKRKETVSAKVRGVR